MVVAAPGPGRDRAGPVAVQVARHADAGHAGAADADHVHPGQLVGQRRALPYRHAMVAEQLDHLEARRGRDAPLVAHNASFDLGFINAELQRLPRPLLTADRIVDTLALARRRHHAPEVHVRHQGRPDDGGDRRHDGGAAGIGHVAVEHGGYINIHQIAGR